MGHLVHSKSINNIERKKMQIQNFTFYFQPNTVLLLFNYFRTNVIALYTQHVQRFIMGQGQLKDYFIKILKLHLKMRISKLKRG